MDQPYPVDPYSAICDDHTYIHTYIQCHLKLRIVTGARTIYIKQLLIAVSMEDTL